MNSPVPNGAPSAEKTTSLSAVFWTRVHRYRSLLRRRWWVLLLTISLGLCLQAWRVATQPPNYRSEGQVIMDGRVTASDRQSTSNDPMVGDFQKTTAAMITSPAVRRRAREQVEVKEAGVLSPGAIDQTELEVLSAGTLFTVQATGPDPKMTQKFLDETMNAFLDVRRQNKADKTGRTATSLKEEILRLESELKKDDEAILDFQRTKGVVLQKGDGTDDNKLLQALKSKLYQLKTQADQLELQDPNQTTSIRALDSSLLVGAVAPAGQSGQPSTQPANGTLDGGDGDVRVARQNLTRVQAEYEDLSRDLKPAHPKMKALKASLDQQKKALDELLNQNKVKNKDLLVLARSLIQRTQTEITEAESKTLDTDLKKAELDKLRTKRDRDEAHYNSLQKNISDLKLTTDVDQDNFAIFQRASPPISVKSGWVKNLALGFLLGLVAGVGILLLLDRIDDRMGSFSDFQAYFPETVIGQIPRDAEASASKDGVEHDTKLLEAADPRHQLVESYRNIRSSLLYMPIEGERPKTLLITSAVPNEGKSTIATNLALVMAFAGMKTLLIDCDLRRGEIHNAFGLGREPGLSDVLARSLPWQEAVRASGVENLSFLPRGRNVPQPSEYLLNPFTDAFIKEIYPHYDYIIIDSSPVLAADDTASLAPKMDATLFVVRLAFTSAKMSRKALEILDNRQANIPGVILNFVDTKSPEFVYYQYPEYYHSPTAEDGEPVKVPQRDRRSASTQVG